jgi:3-phosphoshikimate 1-carboxyvinyltransferase
VEGFGGLPSPPIRKIDVGNSGTTCRMALGTAALLSEGEARFDGDAQTRRRPMGPLLDALSGLGARAISENGDGRLPAKVSGPWLGGETQVDGSTSQYTSSLILNAPFGEGDSIIEPIGLNERPYVDMTLWWLEKLGLSFEREGYERFHVPGNQALSSFDMEVPADFSSAAFMVAAGALPGGDVLLEGLDMDDPQGDKVILGMVAEMGAEVSEENGSIRIRRGSLKGGEFDLNSTPDLLPVMAILGAFADGETRLVNVPQARIKETDRIAAMREVIELLGGSATELPDGIIVRGGGLKGGKAHGFGDHRVVMAAAIAGLAAPLGVEVDTAEAMAITFPDFCERMRRLGALMEKE